MKRTYSGARLEPKVGTGSGTIIMVTEATAERVVTDPLPHMELHSPTGMSWGYAGSGPADLALSILAHHFGETTRDIKQANAGLRLPPHCLRFYQAFKFAFVAGWGNNWSITAEEIDQWINQQISPEETKPLGV